MAPWLLKWGFLLLIFAISKQSHRNVFRARLTFSDPMVAPTSRSHLDASNLGQYDYRIPFVSRQQLHQSDNQLLPNLESDGS
jgi:hypothetical protein